VIYSIVHTAQDAASFTEIMIGPGESTGDAIGTCVVSVLAEVGLMALGSRATKKKMNQKN
jgi:hypothetical protein